MSPNDACFLAFSGPAGSGKSEAASRAEARGFHRAKFANALKHMLRAFLQYRGADAVLIERMLEGDLKGVPSPFFNGRTPRHAMQTLGTGWGREDMHPDLWTDTEFEVIYRHQHRRVVFDDCRFPNEFQAIVDKGGRVERLTRPGYEPAAHAHASETVMLNTTATIVNDSTVEDLRRAVDKVINEVTNGNDFQSS